MSWPQCGVRTVERGLCKATIVQYDSVRDSVFLEMPYPSPMGEGPAAKIYFWASMSSVVWVNTEAANKHGFKNANVIGTGYAANQKLKVYEESKKS